VSGLCREMVQLVPALIARRAPEGHATGIKARGQRSVLVEARATGINRFWVEPDPHEGWIVKREDPPEIYRYSDKGSAEKFAQALAQRYRPSMVSV